MFGWALVFNDSGHALHAFLAYIDPNALEMADIIYAAQADMQKKPMQQMLLSCCQRPVSIAARKSVAAGP